MRELDRRPFGRIVAALVTEAQTDPSFGAEWRAHFVEPRRDQARTIFERAVARDEIDPKTNVEVALDLLYGPLHHRLLHGHAPLNDRFARQVVDTALAGIAPTAEATVRVR